MWPSFSWVVVPFRHVTPVLRVHASPSHMVSVLSFVSASLRLHPTAARVPLLFSWHGSRPDGGSSGLSVWHRVGGSTKRASYTPSPSDTCFSGGSVINTSEFARRHFGMFRDGTKPRCIQKEVHRVLVVRAMRVGPSVTAIMSRRRSVLRPAILAPRPRCCRGGFLHTVVF